MKAAHGSVFKYGDNVDTDVIIPAILPIRKNLPHTVWKISIKIS